MAFVYKADRKMIDTNTETGQKVGPGSYVGHAQYDPQPSYTPFLFKTGRHDKATKDFEEIPGPGSYNVTDNNMFKDGEFQLLSSLAQDSLNVEATRKSQVFKSKTKRFI